MTLTLEVAPPEGDRLGSGRRHTFSVSGGTIGRAGSCDWVLSHRKVSGRHAVVSYQDGAFYILDHQSANGIFLNSTENRLVPGRRYALQPGDRIIIDPYEIDVSIAAGARDDVRAPVRDVRPASPFGQGGEDYDPFEAADPFAPRPASTPRPLTPPAALSNEPAPGEVVPGEEVDPLKLLGGAPKRRPRQAPSASDLESASPLAGHYEPPPVVTPPPAAAPAPPSAPPAFVIPADYDPLSDNESPAAPQPGVTAGSWTPSREAPDETTRDLPRGTPRPSPPSGEVAPWESPPQPTSAPNVVRPALSRPAPPPAAADPWPSPPETPRSSDATPASLPPHPAADPFAAATAGRTEGVRQDYGGPPEHRAKADVPPYGVDPEEPLEARPIRPASARHVAPAAPVETAVPESEPESARTTPAPAAREPARHAPTSADPAPTAASDAALAAVLAGAGLEHAPVTVEFGRSLGQIFRVVVSGVMDVLRARQQIKDEFRMRMTQFRPVDNNPLKFSANVDDALHNLLVKRNAAYLEPVEAFEDAFDDLREHQIAVLAGMRVAFETMLAEFNPDTLQQQFDKQMKRGALLGVTAKLRYWDLYRDWQEAMVKDPEAAFRRLFGEEFARAYEEQLQRLKSERRARGSGARQATPRPSSDA